MKNRILLIFLISFALAIVGVILKIEGRRGLGDAIMLTGAAFQLIAICVWIFKQRNGREKANN